MPSFRCCFWEIFIPWNCDAVILRFSLAMQGPALTRLQKQQLLRTRPWGRQELTYQRALTSWAMSLGEKWTMNYQSFSYEILFRQHCVLWWNRTVYEQLVANGTIVPAEEVPPPTVPMDYSWARVITPLFSHKLATQLKPMRCTIKFVCHGSRGFL